MKFISILLLLSSYTLSVYSQITYYINLTPYQTNQCDKESAAAGVGYNIVADLCTINMGNFLQYELQADYQSWYFGISSDSNGNTVVYANNFNNGNCTGTPLNYYNFGIEGTCSQTNVFDQLNSTIANGSILPPSFLSVSVTTSPQYPPYSLVYQVFNPDINGWCGDTVLKFSTFITNNFQIDYENGATELFSCDNSQPVIKYCDSTSTCTSGDVADTCNIINSYSTSITCPQINLNI